MKQHKTAIDNILTDQIHQLSDDNNVIGIVLFGSAASGAFDLFSDIDLYCITRSKPALSRQTVTDEKSNIEVETLYDSSTDLTSYIHSERHSAWRTISGMFNDAQILYSVDNTVNAIIVDAKSCLATKTELTNTQSVMLRYSLTDFYSDAMRAIECEQPVQFMLYAERLIQNAIEISLRVHNGFFVSPKKLVPYLEKTDKELSKLLQAFYSADKKQKLNTLSMIQVYSLAQLGGKLPKNWSLKTE